MTEKIILSKIQSFNENTKMVCCESNEKLAGELGLSEKTVKRALSSLEDKGFIKKYMNGCRRLGISVCKEKFNKNLRISD